MRKSFLLGLTMCLIAAFLLSGCGGAPKAKKEETKSAFPNKPIEFLVPSSAGGGSDLLARALASATKISQPIVIVNKGEAGGTAATLEAAKAKPDGHKVLLGTVGPFETQPHLMKLEYSIDDFRPIIALTYEPLFLAVNANSPWKTLDDFLKEKDSGKTINYGSSGPGSVPDLAQAIFYKEVGIKASSVPFKGSNPAITALIGGNVDAVVAHPGELLPHVKAGKLRMLGIFSPERFKLLPDVPTLKEKGYNIDISAFKFVLVPKGTPDETVAVLKKAFAEAINTKEFQAFLTNSVSTPLELSESEMVAKLKKESEMYGKIIKEIGVKK